MAHIQIGTADGSTLGNPIAGDFYIFIDSNNANKYTLRNSAGTDTILGGGVVGTLYGLYSQTADGAVVVNTTTETSIIGTGVGSLTVPANTFQVGDSFHVKIGGLMSSIKDDELILRVKNGGTVLATTGNFFLEASTTDGWEAEIDFTIRTIGATGSIITNGNFCHNKTLDKKYAGTVFQDTKAIDTTIIHTLDITAEWVQADAADSIQASNCVIYKTY